mgnify:CR=1 FL=1
MKKKTGILSFVSQASTIIPTKQAQESPRCILPSSGFSSNNITLQQTQSSRIQPSKLSKIQSMYKSRSMQTADFWCFFSWCLSPFRFSYAPVRHFYPIRRPQSRSKSDFKERKAPAHSASWNKYLKWRFLLQGNCKQIMNTAIRVKNCQNGKKRLQR